MNTPLYKNSRYETGFEEISIPFKEKMFKIQKSKVPLDSNPSKLKQKAVKKISRKRKCTKKNKTQNTPKKLKLKNL